MTELAAALRSLPTVSLPELTASAALMDRVDRKYFVPRALLSELLGDLDGFRVLEIAGVRTFQYRTVYFDSPDFGFFRQHVQRRRNRFKVRTRTYTESGDCMLEVKSKGLRGRTVKQRRPHDFDSSAQLNESDHAYISAITGADAAHLHPVLETVYRRSTLSLGDQRVTLDIDLDCHDGARRITGPHEVLVETKSPGGAGALDRMLLHRGIRPHSVSKYCIGAALLYPHLQHNDWSRLLRRYWGAASSGVMQTAS